MRKLKISIGSDHGGLSLKQEIIKHLEEKGIEVKDYGTYSLDSCDYPDFSYIVARSVAKKEADLGIVICTTGIGVSIVANKVRGVRCALCLNKEQASLTKLHNNANVLAMSQKFTDVETAKEIVDTFINTPFSNEERHKRRVQKIKEIEGLENE